MRVARCRWTVLSLLALCAVAFAQEGAEKAAPEKPWRGGWGGMRDPEKVIACARELQFNALIVNGPVDRMNDFIALAKKEGIDVYYWFSPIARGKELEPWRQHMRPEDEQRLLEIRADKDPKKSGYQSGGEPLPGHHDVLRARLLCFHRPEVIEHCKRKIAETMKACPGLAGVALDYFGYQNYRGCHCPVSEKRFEAYRKANPDLPRDKAFEQFSLTTLVDTINEMSDHVRSIRPDAKVAIHVYPTFLPEPLYGNRLNLDYCCQTVAWFFEPYWPDEKVRRYTRIVVNEAKKHYPRQQGIPFVGVYVGRKIADKPPERLARELRLIREAGDTQSLSVCTFGDLVKHEAIRAVFKDALDATDTTAH